MNGTLQQLKLALKPLGRYEEYGGQLKYDCPVCLKAGSGIGKVNLEISIKKNAVHCWACNYSGSVWKLIKDYGYKEYLFLFKGVGLYLETEEEEEEKVMFELPKYIYSVFRHKDSIEYLLSRGLTKSKIKERQIKFCYMGDFKDAIIFPSYNLRDELTAYIVHFPEKKKYFILKNINFICFYESFIDKSSSISLVEGIYDSLVIPNTIPILGTSISVNLITFLSNTDVIYIPDNDVLVKVKKQVLRALFSVCKKVSLYKLPIVYKDINETYVSDKLVLTKELKQFYLYEVEQ